MENSNDSCPEWLVDALKDPENNVVERRRSAMTSIGEVLNFVMQNIVPFFEEGDGEDDY